MNNDNQPDHILDRALSEYRDAEPLAGIEDRILQRIAAQPVRHSHRWAWILATAAVTAVIVMALWLGLRERPHQQTVATSITHPTQQATTSTAHAEKPVVSSARVPHPAGRESGRAKPQLETPNAQAAKPAPRIPSLKQFPAPAPMTPDEYSLLALARTHPDALPPQSEDRVQPEDNAKPTDTDNLSIAPIEIKPLAPEAEAPQGEQQ